MDYETARDEWFKSKRGAAVIDACGILLAESAFLAGYRGGLREGIGTARELAAAMEATMPDARRRKGDVMNSTRVRAGDKIDALVNTFPFFDDSTAERFASKLSDRDIGILHNICELAYCNRHRKSKSRRLLWRRTEPTHEVAKLDTLERPVLAAHGRVVLQANRFADWQGSPRRIRQPVAWCVQRPRLVFDEDSRFDWTK